MSAWAFFDFAILIIAALFAFFGVKSGLIVGVCRFLSLVGGFFVSFLFYRDLQAHFAAMTPNAHGAATAATAFLVIFLAVSFAIICVGNILRKLIKFVMLGWLDRTLGLALGLITAAIIAWVVCLSISSIPSRKAQDEMTRASVVYRTFKKLPEFLSLEGMEGTREAIRGKKPEVERDIIMDDPNDIKRDTI